MIKDHFVEAAYLGRQFFQGFVGGMFEFLGDMTEFSVQWFVPVEHHEFVACNAVPEQLCFGMGNGCNDLHAVLAFYLNLYGLEYLNVTLLQTNVHISAFSYIIPKVAFKF